MQISQSHVLHALASRSHNAVGVVGEVWLMKTLQNEGYVVEAMKPGRKQGDLLAIDRFTGETTRIEVKTARQCSDGKWRYTLTKDGHTDHRHADKIALLAVLESGRVIPFIVPVEVLKSQRQAVITSHPERYAGKLSRWRVEGSIIL